MVLIEAIIKPFKMDDLKDAMEELGVGGMTLSEILQTVPPRPRGRSFGAPVTATDLAPKIKVEIAAPMHMLERVIEAICLHASSGKMEDGKIWAIPLSAGYRIRTGESDRDAISS